MTKFWILWTYIANYSERPIPVEAKNAREAARLGTCYFSDDFQKKATVYVFDREPVFVKKPGT
jgi:hypothetical protein